MSDQTIEEQRNELIDWKMRTFKSVFSHLVKLFNSQQGFPKCRGAKGFLSWPYYRLNLLKMIYHDLLNYYRLRELIANSDDVSDRIKEQFIEAEYYDDSWRKRLCGY